MTSTRSPPASCAISPTRRRPSPRMFGYKRAAAAVLALEAAADQPGAAGPVPREDSRHRSGLRTRDPRSARQRQRRRRWSGAVARERARRRHRRGGAGFGATSSAAPRCCGSCATRGFGGPAIVGLQRRPADALGVERRGAVARRDRRRLPGARLPLCRRHRPFARAEDRRTACRWPKPPRSARRSSASTPTTRDASASFAASKRTSAPTVRSICRADEAACFELVLAAPHSKLRRSEDQTARMLAAVANPARPRAGASTRADYGQPRRSRRRLGRGLRRGGQRGVAIEIDGDPSRQDLDFTLAERALAAGCLFALDSDAHAIAQLRYAETAHRARAAGRHSAAADRELLAAGAAAGVAAPPATEPRPRP